MKKFIYISFIFLFLSFSVNTINVFAQQSKTLTQGIYNVRDANLLINTPITIRITSDNSKVMILIIDSNQNIKALVRLNSQASQQVLPPLNYDDSIRILGNGEVLFS